MNTDQLNVDAYRNVLQELSTMKGNVLGFSDFASKVRVYATDDLKRYRQSLRRSGRKDHVVTLNGTEAHGKQMDTLGVVLPRELQDYDFKDVFDIAVCDGTVFISQLNDDQVSVRKFEDRAAYEAYQKLFMDMWVSTDRKQAHTQLDGANITVNEKKALLHVHNIASAHNLHAMPLSHQQIIDALPDLWRSTHHTDQAQVETDFLASFFGFRRTPTALTSGRNYINYSGSAVTAIIANFLRSNALSVDLLSPCVDLIPDLLKDGGVMPQALDEQLLHDVDSLYKNLTAHITADAVYLVSPNNPTGFCLDELGSRGFEELARYCLDHKKLLIIDMCFMTFVCRDDVFTHLDPYEIFDSYGIDYMIVEDTGKFLPAMDLKAAILHVSDGLIEEFERLHNNFLLRQSPFILKTLTAFVLLATKNNIRETADIIAHNLRYLSEKLATSGLGLTVEKRQASISVAWVRIDRPGLTAATLQVAARKHNIEVLSGETFFWSHPSNGEDYIRIALARDESVFRATIDQLASILLKIR